MAKKVMAQIKLQVEAGKANPSPPIGPGTRAAWRQHHGFLQGLQCADRQRCGDDHPGGHHRFSGPFIYLYHQNTAGRGALLKKAAKVAKGAGDPKRDRVGKVTRHQVEEIAKIKMEDLNTNDLDAACKIISGTARSMGIEVV
jgi:large subunit ribosomal protein L11